MFATASLSEIRCTTFNAAGPIYWDSDPGTLFS
jgi:hypothetical protein